MSQSIKDPSTPAPSLHSIIAMPAPSFNVFSQFFTSVIHSADNIL
jgi:hypothetical protein